MYPVVLCVTCGSNVGSVLAAYKIIYYAKKGDVNPGEICRKLGFDSGCCVATLCGIQLAPEIDIGMSYPLSGGGNLDK